MFWRIPERVKGDLIDQILFNRGISTDEEKEKFFNPKISDYEGDINIKGIEKSLKRIEKAIKTNEQICIYGDYDVDGVCASAILYKALSSLGAKAIPFIPHRDKEGYGISQQGLDFVKDSGAGLVITVDNGIVAINQAEYAKKIGLDLIITDHHLPTLKMPDAYSIVHSTKMCGAAVAWCLIRNIIKKGLAEELLELVALATVCDLMPLLDINRAFVYEGLKILNKTENIGLQSLIKVSGINFGEVSTYEIGHIIGPRINAVGRLEHAIDALRLLCTKDPLKAKKLADFLCQKNEERQQLTIKAVDEARLQVDKNKKIHILVSDTWQSGIIGLIAGRITDEFCRPTIAISISEELAKGSARSIEGVNIVELIRQHRDLLIDIGGHSGAAGFSIKTRQIESFKKRLEQVVIDLPIDGEKVINIDAEINLKEVTKNLINQLKKIEPFGFKNPRPVLVSYGLNISGIRTVGQGKHLKFKVINPEQSRRIDNIDVIAFGMGGLATSLKDGQQIDLVYTPEIDDYNGLEKIQLKVKDIKVK